MNVLSNATVRFIGVAGSAISTGDILTVTDVRRGNPVVATSDSGVCFASHDASINKEVMCLGFGEIQGSSATPISRPLSLTYSDEINNLIPVLNTSDVNTPISTETYTFSGAVGEGESIPFSGLTEGVLNLGQGVWAVLYFISDETEDHVANIHVDGLLQEHTAELSGFNKFMRASALLIESTGSTVITLVSDTSATYDNVRCVAHKLS